MNVKEYLELDSRIDTEREKIIEYNKALTKRFPWLIIRNRWTDEILDSSMYETTELDAMPYGWRIAFGECMCEEIQADLEKFNFVDKFRIMQIKEKYGTLRFYTGGIPADSKIFDIIQKYESLSATTCIECGEPAVWISTGWISPFCDKCASKEAKNIGCTVDECFEKLTEIEYLI